jgi:protein-tyrosine phosphatase
MSAEENEARELDATLVSVGKTILESNATGGGGSDDQFEMYRDADATFVHPTTGAMVFTANVRAAQSREMMRKHNIRLVVNTQGLDATNFHESDPELTYFRFPIAYWRVQLRAASNEQVIAWFQPLFNAIDAALERGDSVMIHCLAGAHRAATTTAAFIRYKLGIPPHELQQYLRARRPIVELLPGLYEALLRLDVALNAQAATTAAAADPPAAAVDPPTPAL